jgi:hypothetical protein
LSSPTVSTDIHYDFSPKLWGVALSSAGPKNSEVITSIGFGDLRKNGISSPDQLLLVPLNEKVFFKSGDQIPIVQSISENGKICVASLHAK